MASDLESMERERAMVLAGISHDLRTPLSRLRLALEMSGADAQRRRSAMVADIDEIDAIIGQFLDFARGANEEKSRARPRRAARRARPSTTQRLGKKVERESRDAARPFRFARMARAPRDRQPGRQRAALRGRAGRDRAAANRSSDQW